MDEGLAVARDQHDVRPRSKPWFEVLHVEREAEGDVFAGLDLGGRGELDFDSARGFGLFGLRLERFGFAGGSRYLDIEPGYGWRSAGRGVVRIGSVGSSVGEGVGYGEDVAG